MFIPDILTNYMPSEDNLNQMVNFFSIFSDNTRVKIISLLSISELNVTEISEILCAKQSTVSHQLKVLRDNNIVNARRNGKENIYYIVNNLVNEIMMTGTLAIS